MWRFSHELPVEGRSGVGMWRFGHELRDSHLVRTQARAYPAPRGRDRGAAAPPPARGAAGSGAVRLARPPDRRRRRRRLRFWNLGDPHQLVFDETYYVKQAWSMIRFGVEMDAVLDDAKQSTRSSPPATSTSSTRPTGDFVVHPPVGKWVIGWRRAALRDRQLASAGGSRSRSGHPVDPHGRPRRAAAVRVDAPRHRRRAPPRVRGTPLRPLPHRPARPHLMFWALAAFCCLLVDRDQSAHDRWPRKVAGLDRARTRRRSVRGVRGWGWRPWRWVAGVCLGLAAGTKWSGAVLPRRLRPDDGLVGHGCPPCRRRAPGGRRARWSRTRPLALLCDGRHRRRRLLRRWMGLVRSPTSATTGSGPTPTPPSPAGAGCRTLCGRWWKYHAQISASTPT